MSDISCAKCAHNLDSKCAQRAGKVANEADACTPCPDGDTCRDFSPRC